MRIKLVKIGNSIGIRIPKSLLQQCGMEDEVDLDLDMENGTLLLNPTNINARAGWNSAFLKMANEGDDQLLDSETKTEFDSEEWKWK